MGFSWAPTDLRAIFGSFLLRLRGAIRDQLTGGAESFNPDTVHGLTQPHQQPAGEVGEAGRAAHEGRRVRQQQRGKIMLGEPVRGPYGGRGDRARVGNRRFGSGKLVGVVQVIGRPHRDRHSNQVGLPGLAGQSQHGHEGNDARSPADQDRRSLGGPDEPETDRAPHLELVTDHDLVVQELRDFASCQSLHGELDIAGIAGCRGHRIRP